MITDYPIEKFDQAITDYSEGLALKLDLLPISSRQIAEAHYKLSIVLDLTSGRLSDAILHAEKALESVDARLVELRDGIDGQLLPAPSQEVKADKKGKGKAVSSGVHADSMRHLTKSQMEAEIKECEGLKEDLALKVSPWRFGKRILTVLLHRWRNLKQLPVSQQSLLPQWLQGR
jgi:HAT1-interacting factor 1